MTEFDDTLSRLFAEAQETLPAADFLETAAARMRHARRRHTIKQAVFATAGAGIAVALTPDVVEGSLTAAGHLGVWLPALGNALTSPIGWACSLALAAWGVRHAKRLQ
jgi:hypothetical protein